MKRVFIYCRVSTANQIDGDGFPRQEAACREFAEKKGWHVMRVFKEQQTGSDEWTDRKQLSEAMKLASRAEEAPGASVNTRNLGVEIPSHAVDTIIIERSDRLARDLIVAEVFLRRCKENGVQVFAADSGQEIVNAEENPTRTLIRQVLGAVAQFDKSCIVQKMQAGRRAKSAQTGKPCGGPQAQPYGDRGKIAQRNRERDVIRQMRSLRSAGFSYDCIAERLRNARVKNPNGDWGRRVPGVNPAFTWSGKMVERILRRWELRLDL